MTKMGRPSRKTIASVLMFEMPDGNVFYFEIDKKGKSRLIGNNQNQLSTNLYINNDSNKYELSLTNYVSEKLNQQHEISNEEKFYEKELTNSLELEIDKFDLFLEKIDNHLNIDNFIKDYKLSSNMLLPIDAWLDCKNIKSTVVWKFRKKIIKYRYPIVMKYIIMLVFLWYLNLQSI